MFGMISIWGLFIQFKTWFSRQSDPTPSHLGLTFPWIRMRGDRRSSSFRKEKPAGLSRALSWLSVSTLSRQSRRIFHSQSELHAIHTRPAYSHTHLHAVDRDEDDDDNWVYQPQHKIGERRKDRQQWRVNLRYCHTILFVACFFRCTPTKPCCMFALAAVTKLGAHLNGFLFSLSTRKPVNDLFTCTSKSKKWVTVFLWPLVLCVHILGTSWLP